jgi:hypothetical protein
MSRRQRERFFLIDASQQLQLVMTGTFEYNRGLGNESAGNGPSSPDPVANLAVANASSKSNENLSNSLKCSRSIDEHRSSTRSDARCAIAYRNTFV